MNLSLTVTDNVTELLVKILEFTERRHEVLMRNILEADDEGFIPKDLDVNGFADVMTHAMTEHIQNNRLMLCDSETLKFGSGGSFQSFEVVDERGQKFFEIDIAKYMEFQIEKLSENLLNSKIAAKLLGQKHGRTLL